MNSPFAHPVGVEEEQFDAAVLFTDIRRSSDFISRIPPREFFQLLNKSLSAQAAHVREFHGSVIKYTGDGVMAVFRGADRSALALRCAMELSRSDSQEIMPFGIGLADGQVLAGWVGDSTRAGQRRHYDVIGATVHLAARLCDMAAASEVMATRTAYSAAGVDTTAARFERSLRVRGFEAPIDCVALEARGAYFTRGLGR
jgi:adenylate cyclase